MNHNLICPLCKNNDISIIEEIRKNEIHYINKKIFNIDISNIIKKDFNYIKCNTCSLGFFNPMFSGDSDYYDSLNQHSWYYLHEDKTEFIFSKKYIEKDMHVLDIGSGRGVFKTYIDTDHYTGLELSSNAVELAKKDSINVINTTIEDFALNSKNTFDVIVSFQVLEHITNVESFILSSIKILKENGKLIIAVPNSDSFIKNIANHLLDLPPHHILHWNEKSLKYLAKKYNLNVVEVFKERVTNIHKKSFYTTATNKIILNILGITNKRIDTRFVVRAVNKISYLMAKFFQYLTVHKRYDGQTIIIVLEK